MLDRITRTVVCAIAWIYKESRVKTPVFRCDTARILKFGSFHSAISGFHSACRALRCSCPTVVFRESVFGYEKYCVSCYTICCVLVSNLGWLCVFCGTVLIVSCLQVSQTSSPMRLSCTAALRPAAASVLYPPYVYIMHFALLVGFKKPTTLTQSLSLNTAKRL